MTLKTMIWTALLALGLAGSLAAEEPAILEIRRLYHGARAVQQSEVSRHIILVRDARSVWTARTPVTDEAQVTAQLECFLDGGRISSTVLFETSPDGSWSKTTEHYFRVSGRTAFVYSELHGFHGPSLVERRHYFDAQGREIRALKTVRNPATRQVLADRPGTYPDSPPRLFRSFADLLSGLGVDPGAVSGRVTVSPLIAGLHPPF